MEKKKTLISLMAVVFSLAVFVSSVRADVSTEEQVKAESTEVKAVIIADVNIHNAEIVSQENDKLKISFDLSNGRGVQTDIRYSIYLLKIKDDEGQIKMDEFIYPEVTNLNENEVLKKEIVYEIPKYLKGKFQVWLQAKNGSGLTLSTVYPGDVNLEGTGEYIEIDQQSCFLAVEGESGDRKYAYLQRADIKNEEKILIQCDFQNNFSSTMTVTPQLETYWRSTFGRLVDDGAESQQKINLNSKEKKSIVIPLLKAGEPQEYEVVLRLIDEKGDVISNNAFFHYTLVGNSATIQNIELDRNYYKKGEMAEVSFLLDVTKESQFFLKTTIQNENGENCIEVDSQKSEVTSKIFKKSFPVIVDCFNPRISASLEDKSGKLLDGRDIPLVSDSPKDQVLTEKKDNFSRVIAISLIALVGIILVLIFIRKKRGTGLGIFFFPALLISGLIFSNNEVNAASMYVEITHGDNKDLYVNITVNKTVFNEGENMVFTGDYHMTPGGDSHGLILIEAKKGTSFNKEDIVNKPDHRYDTAFTFSKTLTAPSTQGNYSIDYYATFDRIDHAHTYYASADGENYKVNALVPAPTCTADYSKSSITSGDSNTLTWTSTNDADGKMEFTCTNFGPNVGGTLTYNGTGRTGTVNANADGTAKWVTSVNASERCTFTAKNSAGVSVTCNDTQTVNAPIPAPTCTADYSKSSITSGDSNTLTWTSTNDADGKMEFTCTNFGPNVGGTLTYNGTGRTGTVNANADGTAKWVTSVNTSERCTFTAKNSAGVSVTCNDTQTVNASPPPGAPTCTADYSKSSITSGDSNTLTWTSTNDADGVMEFTCTNFGPNVGGIITYNGTGRSNSTSANSSGTATWITSVNTTERCTFTAKNSAGVSVTCNDTQTVNKASGGPVCGNGVLEGLEACDLGVNGNGVCPKTCNSSCEINDCEEDRCTINGVPRDTPPSGSVACPEAFDSINGYTEWRSIGSSLADCATLCRQCTYYTPGPAVASGSSQFVPATVHINEISKLSWSTNSTTRALTITCDGTGGIGDIGTVDAMLDNPSGTDMSFANSGTLTCTFRPYADVSKTILGNTFTTTLTVLPASGPVCGNGVREGVESCDLGDASHGNGNGVCPKTCSASCTNNACAFCGNGILELGELCDNGAVNNGACPKVCSASCTFNNCDVCGDGINGLFEDCDDGVNNGGCPKTCSSSCRTNVCSPGEWEER